jgi:hypothetical protein
LGLAAEPGHYSGGKFHPLIVSPDELAVELPVSKSPELLMHRARAGASGVLEEAPWGERPSRFAILRLIDGSAATRMRLQQAPEFVSVNSVYRHTPDGQPILSSGQIVLRLRGEVDEAERSGIFAQYRVEEIEAVDGLHNTFVVRPLDDLAGIELDTANALYRDARTVYAHPDLRLPVVKKQFDTGTDTFFNQQWHLQNTGQGGGTPGADIDIFNAFRRTLGAGVRLGQLDDSCDLNHEDLVDRYVGISHNTADNARNATAALPINAGDRHGTAAMGVMCATRQNAIGVGGVAPDAMFTASRGLESFVTTSQIASAYTFARNQDVDIHNNSWGFDPGTSNPDVVVNAIRTAFDEGRGGRGMVICFASGGGKGMDPDDTAGIEVSGDDELSTLPMVIGVGASNANDDVSVYSNFGIEIDVLAPSNDLGMGSNLPAIVTTDNTDAAYPFEPGFNEGGFSDDGTPNLANPQYTNNFGGTSASSAIVSGIAALILSLEPDFTPWTVRNIIEHTCDKINPGVAAYHEITNRSLRYGYGRVNAGAAVEATFDGFFWPERVADVTVDVPTNTIRWKINDNLRTIGATSFGVQTTTVLIVESDSPFSWMPTDGVTYSVGQAVAPGVTVVANLHAEQFTHSPPVGTKHFGIFSAAQTVRRGVTYGFGVAVTSDGTVIDSGVTLDAPDFEVPPGRPSVTIAVSALGGVSPLTVEFFGNAQSDAMITGYLWDFGDGTTSTSRVTSHTYNVATGTQRFFATLTVTDVNGATGNAAVAIDVSAPGTGDGGGVTGSVRIRVADPSSPDTDITAGIAPLLVVLTAQVTGLPTPSQELQVQWDLGDGSQATSLQVVHTYQNPSSTTARFPISVIVTDSELSVPLQSTRFIDVLPATSTSPSPSPSPTASPDPGNGNGGIACGMGIVTVFWAGALLLLLRRLSR